jgi:hypothetical protein
MVTIHVHVSELGVQRVEFRARSSEEARAAQELCTLIAPDIFQLSERIRAAFGVSGPDGEVGVSPRSGARSDEYRRPL